jgi:hypothetical protein
MEGSGNSTAKYLQPKQADDPVIKAKLLKLVAVCDEVASSIKDHLTGW